MFLMDQIDSLLQNIKLKTYFKLQCTSNLNKKILIAILSNEFHFRQIAASIDLVFDTLEWLFHCFLVSSCYYPFR